MTETSKLKSVDERLAEVEQKVTQLGSDINSAKEVVGKAESERLDNRRARFQNTANWSRHYSAIRLGGTTFFAGVACVIFKEAWAHPDAAVLKWFALGTWGVAAVIFASFTLFTIVTEHRENTHRKALPTGDDTSGTGWGTAPAIASHVLIILLFLAMTTGYVVAICNLGSGPTKPEQECTQGAPSSVLAPSNSVEAEINPDD